MQWLIFAGVGAMVAMILWQRWQATGDDDDGANDVTGADQARLQADSGGGGQVGDDGGGGEGGGGDGGGE